MMQMIRVADVQLQKFCKKVAVRRLQVYSSA